MITTHALHDLHVLVTRPAHQADALCRLIDQHGGVAIRFPTLAITNPHDITPAMCAFAQLATYHLAIFTSANAVVRGFPLLHSGGGLPHTLRIAAIGKATTHALAERGVVDCVQPLEGFTSEALLDVLQLQDWAGKSVLIIGGEGGRDQLLRTLSTWGAHVVHAAVYRRVRPTTDPTALLACWQKGGVHAVVITSQESLINLHAMLGSNGQPLLYTTPLVVVSARIARAATTLGCQKVFIAEGPGGAAICTALSIIAQETTADVICGLRHCRCETRLSITFPSAQRPSRFGDSMADQILDKNNSDDGAVASRTATLPIYPPTPHPKSGRGLAGLALLIALGASGASGTLWYLWQQAQLQQLDRLEALKKAMTQPHPDLQALHTQVEQIPALQQVLDDLRAAHEDLRGQMAGVMGDLQPLKNAMELQKGENSVIKGEIALLRDGQTAQKGDLQKQRGALDQQLQAQQEQLIKLGERLQNLRLSQTTLENDFDTLRTTAAKGGDVNAFPLTEVEYLLHLADNKISLEHDVNSARLALEIAQQRLKAINETTMATVQTMLAESIASLRGVELPDRAALSHKIVEISGQIATLPLLVATAVPDIKSRIKPAADTKVSADIQEGAWWERAGKAVFTQFKNIVVIRRIRSDAPPLVAIEEEFFLRQNLRLQVESMRTALLRGDAQTYQDTNELVREWAARYFDAQDARVATFLTEVKTLQTVQFYPYVPDLSGLNQAFHAAIAQRQPIRSVTKTPVPAMTNMAPSLKVQP